MNNVMANMDKKFNEEEKAILNKNKLMAPSELLKLNVDQLKDYAKKVEQLSKDYGTLSGLKKEKTKMTPKSKY